MKRTLIVAVVAIVAIISMAACTPREVRLWQDWNRVDPVAAQRFARNLNTSSTGGAQAGNCSSYNFAAYGLPTATFRAIAWRESGCNWQVRVVDSNDVGGGLVGFNFKGNLVAYWQNLCGLNWTNLTSSLDRQMRCAAAAYRQLGLDPLAPVTWQLIHGDARHVSDHLGPGSVDAFITSPPYFALRSYRDGGEHYDGQIGSEPTPTDFLDALIECTRDWLKVLRPGGSIFVNLGDKYSGAPAGNITPSGFQQMERTTAGRTPLLRGGANPRTGIPAKSLMGLPWRYAIRCIDELGLILRAEIVWSKPNGLPESVTDRVRRSHEQWFHFVAQPRYFAGIDEVREPAGTYKAVTWEDRKADGHPMRYGEQSGPSTGGGMFEHNPLGKLPGSVWTIEDTNDTVRALLEAVAAGAIDADEAARLLQPDIERSHEQWFHFTVNPRYFAGIDEIREAYSERVEERQQYAGRDNVPLSKDRGDRGDGNPARGILGFGHRGLSPLGKLPGSVWTIPSEPLNPPAHLNIDHYAAYPTEWPRRLILGWTPTGYCTECGEARRAVVENTPEYEAFRRKHGLGDWLGADRGDGVNRDRVGKVSGQAVHDAMGKQITSYACNCPTPDAPTRPAVVVDPFCGTGTTVAVAHHLGRHGIGIDLSNDYLRLAEWRCSSDEALRAKVLDRTGIPRPKPPVIAGQADLFADGDVW